MPTWRKCLHSLIFFMMVAAADIGNMIVIWIVISDKRMRSVTNYFLVNLSIADIINATFNVIPNFAYMLTGNWPFGWVYCKLGTYFSLISVTCSVFTLVAISVDRYNAIINPLRPRLSRLKTIFIATSIWSLGLCISVPPLLYQKTVWGSIDNRTQCISAWPDAAGFESKLEYGYNVSFMVVTYFLPMISMLYVYTRGDLSLVGELASLKDSLNVFRKRAKGVSKENQVSYPLPEERVPVRESSEEYHEMMIRSCDPDNAFHDVELMAK
ncbi:tachykinin-like peptides receptor 99D [Eurytemora carolleeae]|uniref:tachykinin-like peptides receptor 99D n=1 Tax=Eurytemora carolleeae TaxID=1294199 RepID=UPI000C79392E|nr:tachykinin-like peptides receptor 99D [Eurytemora carolleeae]|eukprot:XP_023344775.1 tachykinin-like peptides receptor 99D [Eurytemora affinis]